MTQDDKGKLTFWEVMILRMHWVVCRLICQFPFLFFNVMSSRSQWSFLFLSLDVGGNN